MQSAGDFDLEVVAQLADQPRVLPVSEELVLLVDLHNGLDEGVNCKVTENVKRIVFALFFGRGMREHNQKVFAIVDDAGASIPIGSRVKVLGDAVAELEGFLFENCSDLVVVADGADAEDEELVLGFFEVGFDEVAGVEDLPVDALEGNGAEHLHHEEGDLGDGFVDIGGFEVVAVLLFGLFEVDVRFALGPNVLDHLLDGVDDEFAGVVVEGVEQVHDDQADEDDLDDGEDRVDLVELAVVDDHDDEVVVAVLRE